MRCGGRRMNERKVNSIKVEFENKRKVINQDFDFKIIKQLIF
jgi:hypothetical protein